MPDMPMHLYETASNHRRPPSISTRTFADFRREVEAGEPIFARWRELNETRRRFRAAQDAENAARDNVRRQYPKRPAHLFKITAHRHPAAHGPTPIPICRQDIEQLIELEKSEPDCQSQLRLAGYERLRQDLDDYEAACAAVDRKSGLQALRTATEAAEDALDIAENRMGDATPTTLRGVAIKLRFGLWRFYYSPEELKTPAALTVKSAIADLVRMRRSMKEAAHA